MNISYIPYGNVANVLPGILPYLQKSELWSDGRSKVDDIVRLALMGHLQLWVVHQEQVVYGFFGLEVKQYPQCKMLAVQYCAMETGTLAEVQESMMVIAEDIAKNSGCAGIEFIGRPGWKKVADAHGYTVQSVMYQKFLKEPV